MCYDSVIVLRMWRLKVERVWFTSQFLIASCGQRLVKSLKLEIRNQKVIYQVDNTTQQETGCQHACQ